MRKAKAAIDENEKRLGGNLICSESLAKLDFQFDFEIEKENEKLERLKAKFSNAKTCNLIY